MDGTRLAAPLMALGCAVITASACSEPTQVTVVVTTDVKCADVRGTTLTVGTPGDLDQRPVTTATPVCDEASSPARIGTLVVVPSAAKDEMIAVKIVLGLGRDPAECVPPAYGPGCIVARRALRYVPHTPLTLRVFMSAACSGVACGATETCVRGDCHEATIADPNACVDSCDEGVLRPGSGVPDAGTDATK